MARIIGTADADRLFGTGGKDVIIGLGGQDLIQGNGGNDLLMGTGTITGDGGRDRYFSVRAEYIARTSSIVEYRTVDLGAGNDRIVLNNAGDLSDIRNYAGFAGANGITLGSGSDIAVVGEFTHSAVIALGQGADTAYLMQGPGFAALMLGDTFSDADGARDTVHVDAGGGEVLLYGFGRTDQIVVHGTSMTAREVRQRTTFEFGDGTQLDLTLKDGTVITVRKDWSGYLGSDNLVFVDAPLTRREKVVVSDGGPLVDAIFGSGSDDTIVFGKGAVFAGSGDDVVKGGAEADLLFGEAGDDRLVGRGGADTLEGGLGDDTLIGGGGADTIRTGAGADRVLGGAGADTIHIQRGAKTVAGQGGADRFILDDAVFAEAGAALVLKGGRGEDDYVFRDSGSGLVIIEDFRPGRDDLRLEYWPDYMYEDGRAQAAVQTLRESARHTSDLTGDYPAAGLVISLGGGTEILLLGLNEGALGPGDVLS